MTAYMQAMILLAKGWTSSNIYAITGISIVKADAHVADWLWSRIT